MQDPSERLAPRRREISIDMVIDAISKRNGIISSRGDPPVDVRQGMFSFLGLLTMLYDIPRDFSKQDLEISKPSNPDVLIKHRPLEDTGTMPLGTLLASFGVFIPRRIRPEPITIENWPPKQPDSIELSTSVLNAFAITRIGKLKIKWSELFSTHLMFDRNTRTLTLFRFPTFCALNHSRHGERTLFDQYVMAPHNLVFLVLMYWGSVMEIWDQDESELADANRSMFREALLSYRLLFGQNFDLRSLFRSCEEKRASSDGYIDHLLVRLCGSSKDISTLTDDDTFYEQAFYDSVIDFPHYGPRLEVLQRYISARKSRNIKDLWQDRRDPERWVLIWFVLILTVVTILLSLVQIGLGACQVRLAQAQVELAKRALMEE
ncbi:MAG: hypothetical protein Q9180_002657 [Flavoplaca navasiana]